jgi:hypothetical protein
MPNDRVTIVEIHDGWRITVRAARSPMLTIILLGMVIGWMGVLLAIARESTVRAEAGQPAAAISLMVAAGLWTVACGVICMGMLWTMTATEAISFTSSGITVEDYLGRFRRSRTYAIDGELRLRVEEFMVTRKGHTHKSRRIAFDSPTGTVKLRSELSDNDLDAIMSSAIGSRFQVGSGH